MNLSRKSQILNFSQKARKSQKILCTGWKNLRFLRFLREIIYFCKTSDVIMDKEVTRIIRDYFKTKPVDKAWVFGSFSRGEEKPGSDIDILVSLSPNSRLGLQFFGMIIDLERELKRPVDLVVEGDLLPFARESAEKDKILVYERAS